MKHLKGSAVRKKKTMRNKCMHVNIQSSFTTYPVLSLTPCPISCGPCQGVILRSSLTLAPYSKTFLPAIHLEPTMKNRTVQFNSPWRLLKDVSLTPSTSESDSSGVCCCCWDSRFTRNFSHQSVINIEVSHQSRIFQSKPNQEWREFCHRRHRCVVVVLVNFTSQSGQCRLSGLELNTSKEQN